MVIEYYCRKINLRLLQICLRSTLILVIVMEMEEAGWEEGGISPMLAISIRSRMQLPHRFLTQHMVLLRPGHYEILQTCN